MISINENHLLVDETGAYDGTVRIAEGPGVFIIEADGPWSLTPR